jgi:hypothetical protein
MIIFNQQQKDSFDLIKVNYQNEFNEKGIDIVPIALLGGNFMLNEELLNDVNFIALFTEINNNFTIRNINENEIQNGFIN